MPVEPVLVAAERHHDRIVGRLFREFGVVIAPRRRAVAAADQEEVADLSGLYRIDHLVGDAQHRMPAEPDGDRLLRRRGLEARQRLGGTDQRREIVMFEMAHARPAHRPRREDALPVLRQRLDDAVGRHQDRPGETREVALLVLPRAAVVAGQMRESLERRIRVSRQHFAVRVDLDAGARRLFEQRVQIAEIVARHEDRLARHRRHAHGARLLRAEAAGVRVVEQFHHRQVQPAEIERVREQCVDVGGIAREERERRVDAFVDVVALVAEHLRMMRIRAHALQAVQHQRAQPDDIRAHRVEPRVDADARRLLQQARQIVRRLPLGRPVQHRQRSARGACVRFAGGLHAIARLRGFTQQRDEARRMEVHVGQRGEHRVQHEALGFAVGLAHRARDRAVLRNALHRMNQQVLQVGRRRILAAIAFRRCTAGPRAGPVGLFALIAKHGVLLCRSWGRGSVRTAPGRVFRAAGLLARFKMLL